MYEWVVKGKNRNIKKHFKSYIYFKTVYINKINKCEKKNY